MRNVVLRFAMRKGMLAAITLGVLVVGPARVSAKAQRCSSGTFVLDPGPAIELVAPGAGSATLDLTAAGADLGVCGPTAARLPIRKGRTHVAATWSTCGTLKRLRLKGVFDPTCETITGALTAKKTRKTPLAAHRVAATTTTTVATTTTTTTLLCGDGTRTVGEECDDGNTSSGDGCSATCTVEPPAGQSAAQVSAFHAVNALRASAGLRGLALASTLDTSAQAHATYFVTNPAAYSGGLPPFQEDMNFPNGFTGVNFFDRMAAAGFSGAAFSELLTFFDDQSAAVPLLLNTVLHRAPLLHPNVTAMGYGGASGAGGAIDVFDFGSGASEDPAAVIVFPPPGASGVVGSFAGGESPQPPAPPGGFPSGPIVSLFFDSGAAVVITRDEIRDAGNVQLPHALVTPQTPTVGPLMLNSVALYAHGPAAAGAAFHVIVEGTVGGTAFSRDWVFTVQ